LANLQANISVQRSAQQLILGALRKTGALRSGQNMSAAELSDCLTVLQDMVDAWSAERLMIYTVPFTTQDQNGVTLSLKAGQQAYKLGNANGNEDFLLPRPPRLELVSIVYSASQSTPVEIGMDMYTEKQWQGIPNKSTQSLLPQICYVEVTPDGTDYILRFWPIPTQANPVVLYPWAALNQFPNLNAKFFFPPAYSRGISFNLAVDLALEFGTDLTKFPLVIKEAGRSKAVIQAINLPLQEVYCDEGILGAGGRRGNIFAGGPNRNLNG
jgi:hypothetical protein